MSLKAIDLRRPYTEFIKLLELRKETFPKPSF